LPPTLGCRANAMMPSSRFDVKDGPTCLRSTARAEKRVPGGGQLPKWAAIASTRASIVDAAASIWASKPNFLIPAVVTGPTLAIVRLRMIARASSPFAVSNAMK